MNELLNKEPVKRVQKKLLEFDASNKVMVLDSSARTALEAAESLNTDVGSIVKSLLFKSENNFILCLVSGDRRCSLNKLKKNKTTKRYFYGKSTISERSDRIYNWGCFPNRTFERSRNIY